MDNPGTPQDIARFRAQLIAALGPVIIGQAAAIDQLIIALLTGGHVLLTGGAATAKGLLVQAIARATMLDFRRIQFTPDLMPSDITGTEILESDAGGERSARFVPGPVFTNLLMADEINRTPPKTQAALLEAMQEKQVTCAGMTRPLPQPFVVMATKTSIEADGTYALPEAQQDRFMLNVEMATLGQAEEIRVVLEDPGARLGQIKPFIDGREFLRFQEIVRAIAIPAAVQRAIVDLTAASRPGTPDAIPEVNRYVAWGAGVRATQCLALGAKAGAAMAGRDAATIADVTAVAYPVMRHRIGLNFHAENDGMTTTRLIGLLLDKVAAFSKAAAA
jgi:MoxR-like ATPase